MVLNSSPESMVPNWVEDAGNDLRTLQRFVLSLNVFLPNTPILQYSIGCLCTEN